MSYPKISILVPVFNGAPFLAEALDSIHEQDLPDMEILIADDDSSDDSRAIIERYAAVDRRIRWWKNERNLGLAANFNLCLSEAKGDYIKYVLQDDKLLSRTTVSRMAELLDRHPEVSLVGSASKILNDRSRVMEVRDYFPVGIANGRRTIMRCLERQGNLIGEPTVVMFRRHLAGRGFDEKLPQVLDLDMWFQLLEQGDFGYLPEPLCAFRQHEAQQTNVNRRNGVNDELLLIKSWYAKPWVHTTMSRQALFRQIHSLRHCYGAEVEDLIQQMMRGLGRGWYAAFWLRRKIVRPCEKLKRKFRLWGLTGPPPPTSAPHP
jgi:glycosyltransferase involved in cell wall biosynthesis